MKSIIALLTASLLVLLGASCQSSSTSAEKSYPRYFGVGNDDFAVPREIMRNGEP